MSTEENKALARRAWEVVFNQRNLDALSEFYTADALWHQPDQDLQGLEEVKQWLARPFEAFPDLNVSVEDVIAEGDKVAIRYTSRGTTKERQGG
jgi:predicted ester cyclase